MNLWIDNTQVINDWTEGASERSGSIYLTAGVKPIKMQYFDSVLNAKAILRWQGPGISKSVVPSSAFTPAPFHRYSKCP